MRQMIAALLVAAAAACAPAQSQGPPPAQPPGPPPAPAQPARQVPAMSEDRRVQAEDIDAVMSRGDVIVLDVRDPKEIDELGGYEGAINIPLPELEKRLGELPKDKTILPT